MEFVKGVPFAIISQSQAGIKANGLIITGKSLIILIEIIQCIPFINIRRNIVGSYSNGFFESSESFFVTLEIA